ncbi:MAG: ABC transporter ATP-binding protein [Planctomycetota bacterium]
MISIKSVSVRYGDLLALDSLDLELGRGEVFGYIGPNGAGKSTTMKVLACLLRADEGEAHVDGLSVRSRPGDIRKVVGYMPDFLGVYDDLTVHEYLQFFCAAFSVPRKKRASLIDGVLELTDLNEKKHTMVSGLSRGMQQRLGVARVLVHDPKVLLLDEPASGLDPRARIEMRSLLMELQRMGKTIMVSSHILSELHEMCSSIGIIERGKLLFAGTTDEAIAKAGVGERITIRLESDAARAPAVLQGDERILSAAPPPAPDRDEADGAGAPASNEVVVELAPGGHAHHFVIERLVNAGLRIEAFTPESVKLEDVFLRLTKGQVQ